MEGEPWIFKVDLCRFEDKISTFVVINLVRNENNRRSLQTQRVRNKVHLIVKSVDVRCYLLKPLAKFAISKFAISKNSQVT